MDTPQEISNFFDSLCEYVEHKKKSSEKWKHLQKLEHELEHSRRSNTTLNTNFKKCLKGEESNINSKYVNLKERHDIVLKKIEEMEIKLDKLKISTSDEKEKMVVESEENIKREVELEKQKVQKIKEQIEKQKADHKLKVEQLNNELELAQAATALEQDEVETTLRRELIDLNTKIWRQRNANRDLQMQIEDLKRRQEAMPASPQNYGTAVQPDDLNFFLLNQLDDLFEHSLNDNTTAEEDSIQIPQGQQHYGSSNPYSKIENKTFQKNRQVQVQGNASKYQPIPIQIINPHQFRHGSELQTTTAMDGYRMDKETQRPTGDNGKMTATDTNSLDRLNRGNIGKENKKLNIESGYQTNKIRRNVQETRQGIADNHNTLLYAAIHTATTDSRNQPDSARCETDTKIFMNLESNAPSINKTNEPNIHHTPIFGNAKRQAMKDDNSKTEKQVLHPISKNNNKKNYIESCFDRNRSKGTLAKRTYSNEVNQPSDKYKKPMLECIKINKKTSYRNEKNPLKNNNTIANGKNKNENKEHISRNEDKPAKVEHNITTNKNPPKRRKLWNVDDLDYLDDIQMNSEDSSD